MEDKDIKIITDYIGSWFWHLIAIEFLCALIIVIVLGNHVFTIALSLLTAICEFMALKRKKEIGHEE